MSNTSINALSDQELSRHLKTLVHKIGHYAAMLGITEGRLEYMHKQSLAFSWTVEVHEKLCAYAKHIGQVKKKMRYQQKSTLNTLMFMDLPRPPVFYADSDINLWFSELVRDIRSSELYTPAIGKELGIDQLV